MILPDKDEKAALAGPGPFRPPFPFPAFDADADADATPPPKYEEIPGPGARQELAALEGPPSARDLADPPRRRRIRLLLAHAGALLLLLAYLVKPGSPLRRGCAGRHRHRPPGGAPDAAPTTAVRWAGCGDGVGADYACANITVPLDYRRYGRGDDRTAVVAVTKRFATRPGRRIGSLFLNPGGPGGSGTNFAYRHGEQLDKILKGRYDLIGFDPRGVNLTVPFTKCFESSFATELYAAADYHGALDLPTNFTASPYAAQDLARQTSLAAAGFRAGAEQCRELTGDLLAYVGTEAVVRDIDYMARVIDGEDQKINFWGFSYGTVIGQYLVQILPRERIGRIAIDGVVNVEQWASTPGAIIPESINDVDNVIRSFAESCVAAGIEHCPLGDMKASEILRRIDSTIDSLYADPQPVNGLSSAPGVGVVTAANLRSLLFSAAYGVKLWPAAAQDLSQIFQGNLTGLLIKTMDSVDPADLNQKDGGDFALFAITCADVKPDPGFQLKDLNAATLKSLQDHSTRLGDSLWQLGLCGFWPVPSRSRYGGAFGLPDGSLDTPILVVSNTYDPATSLAAGVKANDRLNDNARLIQQNGWGHCSVTQVSYCTADKVRRFFLDGEVPAEKHTVCEVDEVPFLPFDEAAAAAGALAIGGMRGAAAREARELVAAWRALGQGWTPGRGGGW